jgi:proteasome lid subunit RPN8/RPN11
VALIHTHPEDWVDLSEIDQANQVSSRIGFWSVVIPWYGQEPWILTIWGVHVRRESGWSRLTAVEIEDRVEVV